MLRLLAFIGILTLSGCGGEPSSPSSLDVDGARATTETTLGGAVHAEVTLTNSGTEAVAATTFGFGELGRYTDPVRCTPACDSAELFARIFQLPGVAAGDTVTYSVEFIATDIGAVAWVLCVYEGTAYEQGEQVYCGEFTTVIR